MATRKSTPSSASAREEKVSKSSSKSSVSPARKAVNPAASAKQSKQSSAHVHVDKRGIPRSRKGKGALPGNKRGIGNKGGGRQGVYDPKYHPRMAEGVFLLECRTTNKQLADLFDVTESTIETWRVRYPAFRKACELKSQLVDGKAARSLSRRMEGCKVKATKFFYDKDMKCPKCKGEEGVDFNCEHCAGSGWGKLVKVNYVENLAPDVNAAKFWLMNRQGWKENKAGEWEGKLSFGSDEDSIDVGSLPVELQKSLYDALQEQKKKKNDNGNGDEKR